MSQCFESQTALPTCSIEALKADILTKAGSLIVTTGGSGEEILANESEEETEEEVIHRIIIDRAHYISRFREVNHWIIVGVSEL